MTSGRSGPIETDAQEKAWLDYLASRDRAIREKSLAWTSKSSSLSSDEVMEIIREYQAYERSLSALQDVAEEQSRIGRPAFAVNLEGLFRYVQSQIGLLFGLHRTAVRKPLTSRPAQPIDWLSGPESLRNHTCIHPNCKFWLGDRYFVVDICPACGRYPRPA
jgi:hypothetical protein